MVSKQFCYNLGLVLSAVTLICCVAMFGFGLPNSSKRLTDVFTSNSGESSSSESMGIKVSLDLNMHIANLNMTSPQEPEKSMTPTLGLPKSEATFSLENKDVLDFDVKVGEGASEKYSPGTSAPTIITQTTEWPIEEESTRMEVLTDNAVDMQYKIVCNFWNGAFYRGNGRSYAPELIDESLCTHIVYKSAVLDPTTLTLKVGDPKVDIHEGFYRRVVALKKKGIPIVISTDAYDDKYFRLVRNAAARQHFIVNVLDFIKQYGFDGLEINWTNPACWRTDCTSVEDREEKQHLTDFVRQLSGVFKPRGLLLSLSVSPLGSVIPLAYDGPELSKYVDWFSVQCYYYNGKWTPRTAHFSSVGETFYTIRQWLLHGASPNKILMGLPMRGATFTLKNEDEHDFDAPVEVGGGEPGKYTQEKGYLSFYEIMERVQDYTVKHDNPLGTYAYLGDSWISYNDVEDIQRKAEFIVMKQLGGAMISALDEDEFLGKPMSSCGKYPLLSAVNKVLKNANEVDYDLENCTKDKSSIPNSIEEDYSTEIFDQ